MSLAPELEGFEVRFVQPVRAVKAYVCPECHNAVPERTGHVVAWPRDEADRRRHWHTHCWRVAVRRGRVDGV